MSRLTSDGKPKSIHESNDAAVIFLEIYDVEQIPNGTFPLKSRTINNYQWEDLFMQYKLLSTE